MSKSSDPNEQVALSIEQTAHRYGVTVPTIRKWAERGLMPFGRRVGGSVLRWFVSDLEQWEATEFFRQLTGQTQVIVTRSGR